MKSINFTLTSHTFASRCTDKRYSLLLYSAVHDTFFTSQNYILFELNSVFKGRTANRKVGKREPEYAEEKRKFDHYSQVFKDTIRFLHSPSDIVKAFFFVLANFWSVVLLRQTKLFN